MTERCLCVSISGNCRSRCWSTVSSPLVRSWCTKRSRIRFQLKTCYSRRPLVQTRRALLQTASWILSCSFERYSWRLFEKSYFNFFLLLYKVLFLFGYGYFIESFWTDNTCSVAVLCDDLFCSWCVSILEMFCSWSICFILPSMLWHPLLDVRNGVQPIKFPLSSSFWRFPTEELVDPSSPWWKSKTGWKLEILT